MNCRFCGAEVTLEFIDLVNAPPSTSYLTAEQLNEPEPYFPLKIFVCEHCWLVQVDEYKKCEDIFSRDYACFSSFSTSWLRHCKAYVDMIIKRLHLNGGSLVAEIASNDGYLLQYFNEANIPSIGVEPTGGTATAARKKGVKTLEAFWNVETAAELVAKRGKADLMLGNNVLAHVPDINGFVEGFRIALKAKGTVTFEFPHLLNLIRLNQFDTIYHEHFSYLSIGVVRVILAEHGLTVYDVQQVPTHGGSLRVYARHAEYSTLPVLPSVDKMEQFEITSGLQSERGYHGLQQAADHIRAQLLSFLYEQKRSGRRVVAYSASAKGNTLLNYCGIKGTELIEYVVDASPHKQGKYLPGSHIPIVHGDVIHDTRPDFIFLLSWNISEEIMKQLEYVREWDCKFVIGIPDLEIF